MPQTVSPKPNSVYQKPAQVKIAVIGLGYVGLPLAVEFATKHEVVGFDVNAKRIDGLLTGFDRTHGKWRPAHLQDVLVSSMENFCALQKQKN